MKLTSEQIKIVEDWVNDPEGCDILNFAAFDTGEETIPEGWARNDWVHQGRWEKWLGELHAKIAAANQPRLPNDFIDYLVEDIADWEHNGNLYPWADNEVNEFGMGRWTLD